MLQVAHTARNSLLVGAGPSGEHASRLSLPQDHSKHKGNRTDLFILSLHSVYRMMLNLTFKVMHLHLIFLYNVTVVAVTLLKEPSPQTP